MRDFVCLANVWLWSVVTSKVALLSLGGALGTNARYFLARWLGEAAWTKGFPWGTLVINVTGSFLLGVIAMLILQRLPPGHEGWYLLLGTGFCGGYTTFSTFEWETFTLIRDDRLWLALANMAGSVAAGFLAVVGAVLLMNFVLARL